MKGIFCPECNYPLKLGAHVHMGQRVTCARCETKLTVINLEPIELDMAIAVVATPDNKKKMHAINVSCPECDSDVKVSARAHEGQRIKCGDCSTILEVITSDPVELDVAFITKSPNHW